MSTPNIAVVTPAAPHTAVLRTGWQRLNTVCQGGIRRGALMRVNGLAHQYKTQFALTLFRQIALYNTPQLIDPKKKPLLLHISFEDRVLNNIERMYHFLCANESSTFSTIDNDASYSWSDIRDRLMVNGYHVMMGYIDPTAYSHQALCDLLTQYGDTGYEIHLVVLDTLEQLVIAETLLNSHRPTSVRDKFLHIQKFCKERNIAVITPQQLTPKAKYLQRTKVSTFEDQFVKVVADKRCYVDSEDFDSCVDLDLFIHVCRQQDRCYLTIQRGGGYLATEIERQNNYFVLPFQKSTLLDDLNNVDSALDCVPF